MVKQESQRRLRSAALPVEIVRVLDRGAEAGRADHRAVAAGQAALGDVVPARVLQIGQQQLAHVVGVACAGPCWPAVARRRRRRPCGVLAGRRDDAARRPAAPRRVRCRPRPGIVRSPSSSSVSARSKPASRLRAGVHRDAEAGAAGLAAVHRDDERALAPRLVVRIDVRALQEHAVLDGDGVQLAGAHAEEGVALAPAPASAVTVDAVGLLLGAPQAQQRRVQEALPGMRADGVAEQRLVVAPLQAVVAAVLLVGPAGRQVGDRRDVVVDDRLIAQPSGRSRGTPRRAGLRSGRRALRA